MKYGVLFLFLLFPLFSEAAPSNAVNITNEGGTLIGYNSISILEDKTNSLTFQQVQSAHFIVNSKQVPSFNLSKSTFWFCFSLTNNTQSNYLLLSITKATLDSITAYFYNHNRQLIIRSAGEDVSLYQQTIKAQYPVLKLPVKQGNTITLYLKVKSKGPIFVPIYAASPHATWKAIANDNIIFGIYLGIIGVMLLYNLFIFLTVRDKDYLWYVIYIGAIGITQVCLKGFGYRYLWHASEFITNQSVFWSGALSGIATLLFSKSFLHTRKQLPFCNKVFNILIVLDIGGIILSSSGLHHYSYQIINTIAFIGAITIFTAALILTIRGFKPAKFFLLALSFFLLSVIIYILLTSNLIPYNLFTRNILLLGSAIEITLLSFALADKINIYRKEKERSHVKVLQTIREKEDYVRQQNVSLEAKVKHRTSDLQLANGSLKQANKNLSIALKKQKEAETQLVHAEKMASLGQLTAGIAHEINNPINFVKSNINPLTRDIDDLNSLIRKYQEINKDNLEKKLKEIAAFIEEIDLDILEDEIPTLLSGIEDGANRTVEIISGLRVFSRVDETALKKADIHEGINSTLRLLGNIIPYNLRIEKDYDDIPPIECYPGKLNQVFMNLLTNAIQAMDAMPHPEKERITITTKNLKENIEIRISDTGPGIPEDIQQKIFDPFFTTKDVGKGTGLGLSMVYNIIQEHKGTITLSSREGEGTGFIITLPVKHDNRT